MKVLLYILLIYVFIGCAVGPTHGIIVTHTTFPGEFNVMNNVQPEKTATGCIHTILFGIASWGDAGAGSTAYKNGIKKIAYIDHSTLSLFSYSAYHLYRNYCTIVTGE